MSEIICLQNLNKIKITKIRYAIAFDESCITDSGLTVNVLSKLRAKCVIRAVSSSTFASTRHTVLNINKLTN